MNNSVERTASSRVWYREPWPWVLAAGPILVMIAGTITVWLAIQSDDGLVADDYYKQGLAINQVIRRDRVAADQQLFANVLFNYDNQRLRVFLRSAVGEGLPPATRLRILHPTRAGADQVVELPASSEGVFDANVSALTAGRWILSLEDTQGTWRLIGEIVVPREAEARLEPKSL